MDTIRRILDHLVSDRCRMKDVGSPDVAIESGYRTIDQLYCSMDAGLQTLEKICVRKIEIPNCTFQMDTGLQTLDLCPGN